MIKQLSIAIVALLLFSICGLAQDTTYKGPGCGITGDYMSTLGIDVNNPNIPTDFPPGAIQQCGKFSIYYFDMAYRPGQGFDDASVGATRRNTLCAVLNYIQQTFDFSNIPAGQPIRLKVDTSYTTAYPAPHGNYLIWGAPYFSLPLVPLSVVNGFVWDYVHSSPAADPAPGSFHGTMRVNFEHYGTIERYYIAPYLGGSIDWPVDFQNGLGPVDNCQFDLFSQLLHATTHTLGFYSMTDVPHGGTWTGTTFTSVDTSIRTGPHPTYSPTAYTATLTKFHPLRSSSGIEWFGDYPAPYRMAGSGSHSAEEYDMGRLSHGDYTSPLMAWRFREGVMSRSYGKEELRIMHDIVGYDFNSSSFSSSSTEAFYYNNHRPWWSKNYDFRYSRDRQYGYYHSDTIIADYNLVNNLGASLTININSDTSLHDDDGDTLYIIPESLVNFSGCGQGGNNHMLLTLSNGDKTVTFTPRANFIGRAIFGFNLTDKKEKGAFVTYTIDVKRGSNVSVAFGDNLVLNGDFEEGSEVKLKDTAELVNATIDVFGSGNRFRYGRGSSDCHPYNPGVAIRDSYVDCMLTSVVPYSFGHLFYHFPWAWDSVVIDAVNILRYPDSYLGKGNRIQTSQVASMYNLGDSLRPCHNYVLEFDAIRTGTHFHGGKTLYPDYEVFDIGFTDASHKPSFFPLDVDRNFSLPKIHDSSINFKKWAHIKIPFTYCGDIPSDVLYLRFHEWEYWESASPSRDPLYLLDNLSIKEQEFTVSLRDSAINSCVRRIIPTLSSINSCDTAGFSYSWRRLGGPEISKASVIDVSPSVSTSYVLAVSNGCATAYDTITIPGLQFCACGPRDVFGDTIAFYTLTGGPVSSIPASNHLYVTGDITIANTMNLSGRIVLIEKDVEISIADSVKLTLDSCHLFTCPSDTLMWKGMVLQSTSTRSARIAVIRNSMIEDAITAIKLISPRAVPGAGELIYSANSVYNRNITGIYIDDFHYFTSPAVPAYPFRFIGNVFTARYFDHTTFIKYPQQWPTARELKVKGVTPNAEPDYTAHLRYDKKLCKNKIFSNAGISLNEVGATSGTSYDEIKVGGYEGGAYDFNLFDNMGFGIRMNNTNLSSYNNHFINISKLMEPVARGTATPYLYDASAGIFSYTNTSAYYYRLRVLPAAQGINHYFHDCFNGIRTNSLAELEVDGAYITSSHTLGDDVVPGAAYTDQFYEGEGIKFLGDRNQRSVKLTYNNISNMNEGIYVYLNNPEAGAVTAIDHNWFYNSNRSPVYHPLFSRWQYMLQAVEVFATYEDRNSTLSITGNTFDSVYNAIQANKTWITKATISGNTINLWDKTMSTIGTPQYGIQVLGTNLANVNSNIITTPTLGIASQADNIKGVYATFNYMATICNNNVSNIGRSFEFDQLRPQWGTVWAGNTMQNAWKGFVLGAPIDDQLVIGGVNRPAGNKWLGSWSASQMNTFATVDSRTSKLNVRSGAFFEYPNFNFDFPTGLRYTTASPASILIPNTSVYTCSPVTSPLISNSSLLEDILTDSLSADIPEVNLWMAQFDLYKTALMDTTLRDSVGKLDTFMTAAINSRYQWLATIEAALTDGNTAAAQNLIGSAVQATGRVQVGNSTVVVNDVSAANYIVDNYLSYYGIYLRFLDSTLTGSDTTSLQELALKCPAIDGAVVYQARGLLRLFTGIVGEYQDQDCASSGLFRTTPQAEIEGGQQAYSLFPNPNQGSFTIRQQEPNDRAVRIKIYNALGMEVFQSYSTFKVGKLNIDMGQQTSGLYLICIDDEKEKNTCLRFVIK